MRRHGRTVPILRSAAQPLEVQPPPAAYSAGAAGDGRRDAGAGSIRAVRLASWDGADGLEGAWAALVERARGCSVFQTLPWQLCWWESFGSGQELLLVQAFAGRRLVGIAPMMIARQPAGLGGGLTGQVRFIGSSNYASDYCDFIVDPDFPEALDVLLDEIRASAEPFRRIDLSQLPHDSPNNARLLRYFAEHRMPCSVEIQQVAPVRILGDLKADRRAANKTSLKRHTRALQKSGDLRFHRAESVEEVLGYLDAFFEQHQARWASTDTPSQFRDPDQRAFYRRLAEQLFPRGWLRFDVVLFDGAPLAFHFGFEFRGCFIWYKSAFDVRFASRSPGEVLIKYLLEDAIARKLAEFDFTIGFEHYKFRFANQIRYIDRLIAFDSSVDCWRHRTRIALKKLMKRDAVSRSPQIPERQRRS